jgi:hypothetical protein
MMPLAFAYAFGNGMTTYTFITRRGPGPGYFEMKAWSEAGFAAALLLMAIYLATAKRQRS